MTVREALKRSKIDPVDQYQRRRPRKWHRDLTKVCIAANHLCLFLLGEHGREGLCPSERGAKHVPWLQPGSYGIAPGSELPDGGLALKVQK